MTRSRSKRSCGSYRSGRRRRRRRSPRGDLRRDLATRAPSHFHQSACIASPRGVERLQVVLAGPVEIGAALASRVSRSRHGVRVSLFGFGLGGGALVFVDGPSESVAALDRAGCRSWRRIGCLIRTILTPVRTPVANAYAERFVRTIRSECLDWILIRNERHLAHVVREYLDHYNRERPHRGLGLRPPDPPRQPGAGPIQRLDRLGGLIYHYELTAA